MKRPLLAALGATLAVLPVAACGSSSNNSGPAAGVPSAVVESLNSAAAPIRSGVASLNAKANLVAASKWVQAYYVDGTGSATEALGGYSGSPSSTVTGTGDAASWCLQATGADTTWSVRSDDAIPREVAC